LQAALDKQKQQASDLQNALLDKNEVAIGCQTALNGFRKDSQE
jgi:hypothetical protein